MTVFQSCHCVNIADPNSVQNMCRNHPSKYVASHEFPSTLVVGASDPDFY